MNGVTAMLLRTMRVTSTQWWLRVLVVAGSAALVGLALAAGGDPRPLLSVALLGLSVGAAVLPDTHAPLVLVTTLAWFWAVSVPEALTVWTVAATWALVVVHVACTVAALGPPQLSPDRSVLRLWAVRGLVLGAASALVWVAARVLSAFDLPPSEVATVVALGGLLGWILLLTRRTTTSGAP